jgi:hypothetical protein
MAEAIAVPKVNLKTLTVTQRYFAFVNDDDFTLSLNYSVDGSGATWSWQSLGGPVGGVLGLPAATAYFNGDLATDGRAINHFNVFMTDGHLWMITSSDDGASWGSWQDHGVPAVGISVGYPDALSRQSVDPGFQQNIFCHVTGSDGHLYVNYSLDGGASWSWADRGTPSATVTLSRTCSVSFFDYTRQSLFTFAVGSDGHLWAHSGDGAIWTWEDLGTPPGTSVATEANIPQAVTYLTNIKKGKPLTSEEAIWVFVLGTDNHLHACYSPGWGLGWNWEDRGTPAASIGALYTNACWFRMNPQLRCSRRTFSSS